MNAVYHKDPAALKNILKDPNSNPNEEDFLGLSPLHVECYIGAAECARVLMLDKRTDLFRRGPCDITPYESALKGGNEDCSSLFYDPEIVDLHWHNNPTN